MPAEESPSSTEQTRILIIDDSKLMRRAISKILGGKYDIIEAVDGRDGFGKLTQDEGIQLVISDLSMPNMDGFELLDIIREAETDHIRDVPVIIITGAEDDTETKEKALAHGASDFISKPFDSVQLNARVKTHTQFRRTTRKLTETSRTLREQATVDTLTGLANRRYFEQRGNKDLAYAKRHRNDLAILRIDIDGFNSLFVKYREELTNLILKRIGNILLSNTRTEDTAARIGVAKFALILPSANPVGSRLLADRIRTEIAAERLQVGGEELTVSVSMGLASPDIHHGTDFTELLQLAERRLKYAVAEGGNRVVYQDELEVGTVEVERGPAMIEAVEAETVEPETVEPEAVEAESVGPEIIVPAAAAAVGAAVPAASSMVEGATVEASPVVLEAAVAKVNRGYVVPQTPAAQPGDGSPPINLRELTEQVNVAGTRCTTRQEPTPGKHGTGEAAPDIDAALEIVASGEDERLRPYLQQLLSRILPLVEVCNRRLELGLDEALDSLRSRLGSDKTP